MPHECHGRGRQGRTEDTKETWTKCDVEPGTGEGRGEFSGESGHVGPGVPGTATSTFRSELGAPRRVSVMLTLGEAGGSRRRLPLLYVRSFRRKKQRAPLCNDTPKSLVAN